VRLYAVHKLYVVHSSHPTQGLARWFADFPMCPRAPIRSAGCAVGWVRGRLGARSAGCAVGWVRGPAADTAAQPPAARAKSPTAAGRTSAAFVSGSSNGTRAGADWPAPVQLRSIP